MPTSAKLAMIAAFASLSLLSGCNQEQQPTYDQNAQKIDPALRLYANNDPTATPPENPDMPENANDNTPVVTNSIEPEAMLAADKVELTEDQWRSILSDQEFDILRQHGTERAFTGRLLNETDPGSYHCAGCGLYLYDAKHKFHSGCGWPSFNQEVAQGALTYYVDKKFGMVRTEMRCARCDGHLGHVFDDAPDQPTGLRHCVNGGALIFVPQGADIAQTIREHRRQYADR